MTGDNNVFISSNGKAAQFQGGILGQYEYDVYMEAFVQKNTEKNNNEKFWPSYMYQNKKNQWLVGPNIGSPGGWLVNPKKSKKVPTEGWRVAVGRKYEKDPALKVTHGSLTLSMQYEVKATGDAADECPSCSGVFNKTERWWNGRPVYENTNRHYLYHGSSGDGWVIGEKIGQRGFLKGYQSYQSPVDQSRWDYWNGSMYKLASVVVSSISARVRRQSEFSSSHPGIEGIPF